MKPTTQTLVEYQQNINFYLKGPHKKAYFKSKTNKPISSQSWRAIRILPHPRLLRSNDVPLSSGDLQQTHVNHVITKSTTQVSTAIPLSEADDDADDEAETFINNLRGLSQRLNWSEYASTALVCSDTDSHSESLPLSWHDGEALELQEIHQVIQQPTTIETSKWTKLVMGKACKAFGINIAGFEHEILDLILRMDQKRQVQLQKMGSPSTSNKKGKGRKKGETEVQNLICGINYDGRKKSDRDRHCKILSR